MQTNLFATQTLEITKQFPILFRIDTKGKMRSWQIGTEQRANGIAVVTTSGLVDGQKTTTEYLVMEGKNLGRSNESTPQSQAEFETKSKWDAQLRSGYVENMADAKQDILGSGIPAPMLARRDPASDTRGGGHTARGLGPPRACGAALPAKRSVRMRARRCSRWRDDRPARPDRSRAAPVGPRRRARTAR